MEIEGTFEAEALRILRDIPGLTVIRQGPAGDRGADALVRFAGRSEEIAIEFKQRANAATAWELVHRAETGSALPLLLIAGETTAQTRDILGDHGIAFVDGLGNAHLELPGLLLHLQGRGARARRARGAPTRLRGKAGVVAQALLLAPQRCWKVGELAGEAKVSPALAHRVLSRLEGERVVAATGAGPRRVRQVTDPTALLDLWVEENSDTRTRTLAYLLAQTPGHLARELGGNLERSGIDYALTGAAAGSLVAPFVTAVPVVEVWTQATAAPEELCAGAGADPVSDGPNVVFLQAKDDGPLAFHTVVDGLHIVNRFRLYTDLRQDPRRGREQAEHLRHEVIGF